LRAYQQVLPEIQALGGELVAISPMLPDDSLSMAEKNELAFEVLSDAGNGVARRYGLVFRVLPEIRELYEGPMNVILPVYNGDDSWELPVPGTFVVGTDAIVRYAFVDTDHTRRAEPSDVLGALRSG
jgi:peroxiredoxin